MAKTKLLKSSFVPFYPAIYEEFKNKGAADALAYKSAIFFANLMRWSEVPSDLTDGFFYKYIEQLEKETGLKKMMQWRCRQFLKKISWLEEKIVKIHQRDVVAYKPAKISLSVQE